MLIYQNKIKNLFNYFYLILPFLVIWFLFHFLSVILGIIIGFSQNNDFRDLISLFKNFNFLNYVNILKDNLFWISLKNSILYTLIVIPLQLFAFLLAYFLYELAVSKFYFFNYLSYLGRIILYLPVVVPLVSIGFVFKILFNDEGILNQYLALINLKIPFLSDYKFAFLVCMLLTFWKGLGYYLIIYFSGFLSINKEIIESAILEGFSKFDILLKIYLPLSIGNIYFCSFLSFIASLKIFVEVFVLTDGGPGVSTYTLMMYIYSKAFMNYDINSAAAASTILSFIIILFTIFIFKKQLLNYF
jgi:ABC-type sugar transport system permease subunit